MNLIIWLLNKLLIYPWTKVKLNQYFKNMAFRENQTLNNLWNIVISNKILFMLIMKLYSIMTNWYKTDSIYTLWYA